MPDRIQSDLKAACKELGWWVQFDNGEDCLNVIMEYGDYGIAAVPIPTETILGTVEKNGWEVSGFVMVSNYPHAPDDCDEYSIGKFGHDTSVVAAILRDSFERRLSIIMENLGWAQMAKEKREC